MPGAKAQWVYSSGPHSSLRGLQPPSHKPQRLTDAGAVCQAAHRPCVRQATEIWFDIASTLGGRVIAPSAGHPPALTQPGDDLASSSFQQSPASHPGLTLPCSPSLRTLFGSWNHLCYISRGSQGSAFTALLPPPPPHPTLLLPLSASTPRAALFSNPCSSCPPCPQLKVSG